MAGDSTAAAARRPARASRRSHPQQLIGRVVSIYWSGDDAWFTGTIRQCDDVGWHYVVYTDGDVKWHDLRHEEQHNQLRWISSPEQTAPNKRACVRPATSAHPDPSAASRESVTPGPMRSTATSTAPQFSRVMLRLRDPLEGRRTTAGATVAEAGATTASVNLTIGGDCLAVGLHAGQRASFKAKLLRVRATAPQYLVRYVADLDGHTSVLRLPEVKHSYLHADEIAPWSEPACKKAPTALKTRGQISNRESGQQAMAGRRQGVGGSSARTPRRVRFSDVVSIIGVSDDE